MLIVRSLTQISPQVSLLRDVIWTKAYTSDWALTLQGGTSVSILRAMADAIQVSKLYWRLVDSSMKPLTVEEAFYMGTEGGGSFFGKVGSFKEGYEFDAVVLNDSTIPTPLKLSPKDRLERLIYLSDDRNITAKYVAGRKIL